MYNRWGITYIRSREGRWRSTRSNERSNNREWQLSIVRMQIDGHGDRYRMYISVSISLRRSRDLRSRSAETRSLCSMTGMLGIIKRTEHMWQGPRQVYSTKPGET